MDPFSDLTLFVQERGDTVLLGAEYRGAAVGRSEARRVLDSFHAALAACCRRPHHTVGELLAETAAASYAEAAAQWDVVQPSRALDATWQLIRATNAHLEANEPVPPGAAGGEGLLLVVAERDLGSEEGLGAAQVGGGEVASNPRGREWGIAREIRLTDAARSSPMLAGKPPVFDGFIMHLDEVTRLPEGTPRLATNAHTPVQAAILERGTASFWSTQYHPEYNLYEMGRLIAARAGALVREGFFSDEAAVAAYASKMLDLAADPDSQILREELGVGDDLIDPQIREVELRNWLRFVDSRAR